MSVAEGSRDGTGEREAGGIEGGEVAESVEVVGDEHSWPRTPLSVDNGQIDKNDAADAATEPVPAGAGVAPIGPVAVADGERHAEAEEGVILAAGNG